jgi:hypothetical protein
MKPLLSILVVALLLLACDQNDKVNPSDTGEWILYESGYSPGAGYITENVPPVPAQTLKLNADGSLESTIDGWDKYKYYLILQESDEQQKILALYEERPINPNPDVNKLAFSFRMISSGEGNLRLEYRWCIEGCHLAFRKFIR